MVFLTKKVGLHFHLYLQAFMTCVFQKQFLHSVCFVTRSVLSVTDIFLSWEQSIKCCLSSQSQHVGFSLLSSGFNGSSFLSLLVLLGIFADQVRMHTIFVKMVFRILVSL